jgi:imidazolonepropionase-like amidohydrolase
MPTPPAYLIRDALVWSGHDEDPFRGDVLVEGKEIVAVSRDSEQLAGVDAQVIDASGGLTLMPGLIDGHAHLSFPNAPNLPSIGDVPPEEHVLITMHNARTLLDNGFTSAVSAGSAKLRLDVVIRNEIAAGRIPGPRLLAAGPEISTTGNLGDERMLHNDKRSSVGVIADGADEFQRLVRVLCREGVDTIKLNVSGNLGSPARSGMTVMTDAEMSAACETAMSFGRQVAAHARSDESIRRCLRHGVTRIYHCDFASEEVLQQLAAVRDEVFLGPAVGLTYNMIYEASAWGFTPERAAQSGLLEQFKSLCAVHQRARELGLRVLIGGDYGLAWTPQGTNARDLMHFVDHFGYSPHEALVAATRHGGEAMAAGGVKVGLVEPGYRADLLLVRGEPFRDVTILQDAARLALIMQDGRVHRLDDLQASAQAA